MSSARPVPAAEQRSSASTAWIPSDDIKLEQWLDYGRRLGALGRGVAWWIGDWLLYGTSRYGEKYSRAARVTGYDPQSLMNMSYVASRFTVERRRSTLSWSHHAELAALEPEEQDRWLDLAEAERLSVNSLRLELRASRRRQMALESSSSPKISDASARLADHAVVCPKCSYIIESKQTDQQPERGDRAAEASTVAHLSRS